MTPYNNTVLRVCFVLPKAYPLFNREVKAVFGGAEVDLYLLATELAKDERFEVSFVVADYGQEAEEQIDGVRLIKSLSFRENPLVGAVKVWQAMRRAGSDIYFQEAASTGTFLVALYCRLRHRNFIYRTASSPECNGEYASKYRVLGNLFNLSLKSAGEVIVQNNDDRKAILQTLGISAAVLRNGHRIGKLSQADRSGILWVGRSEQVKRPELFIELARRHADEKFTMICQKATGDKNYEQIVSAARDVGNLEFFERVPFDQIDGFFGRARVFVNTSDSEGFPNTFIQACKNATPILSLNVNPDGFLEKYGCGLSCGSDEEKLSRSLISLLENDRYRDMGLNGRKYVQQHHDIEKIVEQYKDMFLA